MIGLRAFDVLGLFVEPALLCLIAALVISYCLRRALDLVDIDRFVWNRALFDFGLLVAVTALLVLALRIPRP